MLDHSHFVARIFAFDVLVSRGRAECNGVSTPSRLQATAGSPAGFKGGRQRTDDGRLKAEG